MIVLDSLLIGGLKFVLDKLAATVDSEMNDDTALREELLAAQMKVELGEMTEEEFASLEKEILQRIREIRERNRGPVPAGGTYKVTGIEATFAGDEEGGVREDERGR